MHVSGVRYRRPVGKEIQLDGDKIKKVILSRPPKGEAIRKTFDSIDDYFDWRRDLDDHTMLLCGTWTADGETVVYVNALERYLDTKPDEGALAADTAHLAFAEAAGICRIDTDCRDHAEIPAQSFASLEEYHATLCETVPWLRGVAALVNDSSSSNIWNGDVQLTGHKGLRCEFGVSDASFIPALLHAADDYCWAAGLGWAFIDTAGTVQLRSPIDLHLALPTQPDYVAPTVVAPLESKREWLRIDGVGMVDGATIDAVPDDVVATANARRHAARLQLEPQAADLRSKRRRKRAAEVGFAVDDAELYENETVDVGGKPTRVSELLAEGEKLDGTGCPNPHDPDYDGGRFTAQFYWDDGRPCIWCHHTKTRFALCYDGRRLDPARAARILPLNHFVRRLALSRGLTASELDARISAAAKAYRTSIKAICADIAKWRTPPERTTAYAERVELRRPPRPLDDRSIVSFPVRDEDGNCVDHAGNVAFMVEHWGFSLEYCQIRKRILWHGSSKGEHSDEALFSHASSILAVNKVPSGKLWVHLLACARRNTTNFVRDHLGTLVWDGVDRFPALAQALQTDDEEACELILRLWFVQSCAAADLAETAQQLDPEVLCKFESILLFIGMQGITKTSAIKRMLPSALRGRTGTFQSGVSLDTSNKDSIRTAISCWITEMGEMESTYKRSDVEELKNFASKEVDIQRVPFGRGDSHFDRSTSFAATANSDAVVSDDTGARRIWPIRPGVPMLDALAKVDVDQLWAQAQAMYAGGRKWWAVNEREQRVLDRASQSSRRVSDLETELLRVFDWSLPPVAKRRWTLRKALEAVYTTVTDAMVKDAGYSFKNIVLRLYNDATKARGDKPGPSGTVTIDGERVPVYSSSGKNAGYLLPPVRRDVVLAKAKADAHKATVQQNAAAHARAKAEARAEEARKVEAAARKAALKRQKEEAAERAKTYVLSPQQEAEALATAELAAKALGVPPLTAQQKADTLARAREYICQSNGEAQLE